MDLTKFIELYNQGKKEEFFINGVKYSVVKSASEEEINYIFFCDKLRQEQLALKERNFKKMLAKNKPILKKTKA